MTAQLIRDAFEEMVSGIVKIMTPTAIPHLYHHSATTHEINSVYHFAKAVKQFSKSSAVYFEFKRFRPSGRCDSHADTLDIG
ncbi:hypothetical protein ACTRXD_15925 [Nitrospira sp. T9]|uniref:hypothetical protein n=1 Tax=unclassified Nitrospira TaxID=2652172 RepID=UPI003F971DFE